MARKKPQNKVDEDASRLSQHDKKEVEEHLPLKAPVVYVTIAEEGREELARPFASLWWSGIAAGLGIGFSVVAEGILHALLPETGWRPLLENWGYSVGFVIVILGRQQLFTEITLTAVLPILTKPTAGNIWLLARIWTIVFLANLVGTAVFGAGLASDLFFPPHYNQSFRDVSWHLMELPAQDMFLRGIVAGWIIATLVWLMPAAETAKIWTIILLTYLIAVAEFTHVVAGSVEAFLLMFSGEVGVGRVFFIFLLPTLIGNIIGGSALFALVAHGQVREEV